MNYQETIKYLYAQLPLFEQVGGAAYKPGLERVEELLTLCGNPHIGLKAVHIAGTNGKGSTSYMMASVLQAAGYKVGLFTSPHLVDFRERIRINGEMVEEEFVVDFVERLLPLVPEGLHPSFFEFTTAMAFTYFREQEVDVAVIEVGMGGRLDSTNVLQPVLSIITNVSIDHASFLGNTLAEIAGEKAGIIKPHTPVVLGRSREAEVLSVVEAKAKECSAPLTVADRGHEILMYTDAPDGGYILTTETFGRIHQPLGGVYQIENSATLLAAVAILKAQGWRIDSEAVATGVARVAEVGLRGRLEVIEEGKPRVLIDTGHNPGAWSYLAPLMAEWQESGGLVVVMGMAADKDVRTVLSQLPVESHYIFCNAHSDRSMKADVLANLAQEVGLCCSEVVPDIMEAYQRGRALAEELGSATLFIGGSNFVVGEFLSRSHH